MTPPRSVHDLADIFSKVGQQLAAVCGGESALQTLVDLTAQEVDGAHYAGISAGRVGGRFRTLAATDETVLAADMIQYELGSGPCVDAIVDNTTFNAADLGSDPRWLEFGRRCVEETGVVSMLALRMFIESDHDLIAGLNVYSRDRAAFDEDSEAIAALMATHGALAVRSATAQAKATNLERALRTSREIGTAIGIVMSQYKVTREQGFDLLRVASQHSQRKLAELATEVADTGALPSGPWQDGR